MRPQSWAKHDIGDGGIVFHIDTTDFVLRPRVYGPMLRMVRDANAVTLVDLAGDQARVARQLLDRTWRYERDPAKADLTVTRAALLSLMLLPGNRSGAEEAAVTDLATKAGIPARIGQKLAFCRRDDWLKNANELCRRLVQTQREGRQITIIELEATHALHEDAHALWRLKASSQAPI